MISEILLYIILPLGAAFLIPIIGRFWESFSHIITLLVFLVLATLSISFLFTWNREPIIYAVGGWEAVNEIPIGIYLVYDGLSAMILGVINFITLLVSYYSVGYIRKFTSPTYFYTLLCLMIAGMNGVVLSGDLFNLFVFLEVASISSYALVAFGVEKEELEASFKYQVLGGLASLIILFSIGIIYWTTDTLNIADISGLLAAFPEYKLILFIQILLITGFGLKAAIVPFHAWLPDAHSSAPSPISSLLSGILIKAIGLYVIIRLFFDMFVASYEVALLLTVLGVLSIVLGGVLAIGQNDYKRVLAYSSISQVGYILTGIGIGLMVISKNGSTAIATLAIFGSLFHLINHAVFKSLLFMTAGAVEHATGIRNLDKLGGLGKKMPVTSYASFSGAMAISGLPPFSGFFSKLIIIIACVQAGYYLVAFIAAIMSVITLAYFVKLQKSIFYSKLAINGKYMVKVPFSMKLPMVVLAILCIGLSVLAIPQVGDLFIAPVNDALIDPINHTTSIFGK